MRSNGYRVRMGLGLALAAYRSATRRGCTLSDIIRMALISWTDREGLYREALIDAINNPVAANAEVWQYQTSMTKRTFVHPEGGREPDQRPPQGAA